MITTVDNPYSEVESENGRDLTLSIGELMTMWQGIEFAVCEVYLAFYTPSMRDVPAVAYHAIRTFDARMQVVDALVSHFCPERYQEWARIKKKIKKTRAVRNAVAHGLATILGSPPSRKWAIGESPYNIKEFKKTTHLNGYITPKEIRESEAAMVRVIKSIVSFRASLEADVGLQSKLLWQQSDVLENCHTTKVTVHEHKEP